MGSPCTAGRWILLRNIVAHLTLESTIIRITNIKYGQCWLLSENLLSPVGELWSPSGADLGTGNFLSRRDQKWDDSPTLES